MQIIDLSIKKFSNVIETKLQRDIKYRIRRRLEERLKEAICSTRYNPWITSDSSTISVSGSSPTRTTTSTGDFY